MSIAVETEIVATLEKAGIRVRSITQISHFRLEETGRAAYRVDHEHGTVKARLLEDELKARDQVALRNELGDAFAPVISRHGRILIEDWIEGDALPDIPQAHYLTMAGALLAEMHARSSFVDRTLHEVRSPTDHRLAAENCIRIAAANGALEEKVASALERILRRLVPVQAAYGLVHLDFCGENMVIDRAGKLRVVDNEHIRLDALGYDLGRTWYRWALPEREWDLFYEAYSSQTPYRVPPDSFRFWKIVAAARSAELRLRACPQRADVPLRCLNALAADGLCKGG